ncbi:MAG: DUF3382 domain-containing protein [SAR324 cluster bacterium]|nr:DUF3382 domain-containing protein [SAR324 cluster bacterium]
MDVTRSLKDAVIATVLAGVLFVPIMGMVLHATSLDFRLTRVAVMLVLVFFGRIGFSLFVQTGASFQ